MISGNHGGRVVPSLRAMVAANNYHRKMTGHDYYDTEKYYPGGFQRMTREMIDATGGKAGWVRANVPLPDLVAWYGTGTANVQWTDSEKSLFPASIMVEIDQGALGSPVLTATVRDVEKGAWAPGQAVDMTGWEVERPTIYVSRGELSSILADGWRGDLWLAWPGWKGEPLPDAPGCTYVAVQDVFTSNYDHSTVLDTTWPHKPAAATVINALSVTVIDRRSDMAFSEVEGADHYVVEYMATGGTKPDVIMRAIAQMNYDIRHLTDVTVPGAAGGEITVYAIVAGKAVTVGSRTLP